MGILPHMTQRDFLPKREDDTLAPVESSDAAAPFPRIDPSADLEPPRIRDNGSSMHRRVRTDDQGMRASQSLGGDDLMPPLFADDEWRRIVSALRLSPRMAEIAELVVRNAQDKEIAAALGISPSTIRSHFNQIFARLHVSSRTGLMYCVFAAYRREVEGTGHNGD